LEETETTRAAAVNPVHGGVKILATASLKHIRINISKLQTQASVPLQTKQE
jgi:hypothetical protein